MTPEIVIAVIGAAFTSPVLIKIIEVLSSKFGKKKSQLDRIELGLSNTNLKLEKFDTALNKLNMDQLRTNILLLISAYPDSEDIPKLAKQYVSNDGNSYVIPIIVNWYKTKNIEFPEWLKKAYDEHCTYSLDQEE